MDFFTEPLLDAVARGDNEVNATRKSPVSQLYTHCSVCFPQATVHLLTVGGSLDNVDESGLTPLHWTASSPQGDSLIPMMVARGANIDATDYYGRTPLHLLAGLGRTNGVTCLLYHSADITIRDKEGGLLAIDYAIIHGHDDVVKLLLAYGAKPSEHGMRIDISPATTPVSANAGDSRRCSVPKDLRKI